MINTTISIVSHNQFGLVEDLLRDLEYLSPSNVEVILTINIPESLPVFFKYSFPVLLICNDQPKGFGANHNEAFRRSSGSFFAVVNPDIRLQDLNIELLTNLFMNPLVAVVAPLVQNSAGDFEDSIRKFPTILSLFRRLVFRQRNSDYSTNNLLSEFEVDWAAGMFLLFRCNTFAAVNGFDEHRFFMYMEDVDICKRIREKGGVILATPKLIVIHNAQRASRRNLKHLRWHIISIFRYFTGH